VDNESLLRQINSILWSNSRMVMSTRL
jgi:hypothetical protein